MVIWYIVYQTGEDVVDCTFSLSVHDPCALDRRAVARFAVPRGAMWEAELLHAP